MYHHLFMSKTLQPGTQGNFLSGQPGQPVFYEFCLLLGQLRWQSRPLSVSCHFHCSPTQRNTDQSSSCLKLASFNRVLAYHSTQILHQTLHFLQCLAQPTHTYRQEQSTKFQILAFRLSSGFCVCPLTQRQRKSDFFFERFSLYIKRKQKI